MRYIGDKPEEEIVGLVIDDLRILYWGDKYRVGRNVYTDNLKCEKFKDLGFVEKGIWKSISFKNLPDNVKNDVIQEEI